jgi:hypothetical protein
VKVIVARCFAAVLIATSLLGCSGDDSQAGDRFRAAFPRREDSSAGTLDLGGASYQASKLGAVGTVAGTVTLDGSAAMQEMVPVTKDQRVCGLSAPGAFETNTKRQLSDAIVWIADVNTGKSMPIDKRVTVSSEDCQIDPRVQATINSATVNVFNDDKLLHTIVFLRVGTNDTLLKLPFFNVGQVVPTEKLAKMSGIIEVRCLQHPWTHGYVAVFDHPYFAVTEQDGSYNIDSLPPGKYRMMIWHEGMAQPVERKVKVEEGRVGLVDVSLNGK